MYALAKGIAHVSFSGGGIVFPARTAYDRQVIAEQVAAHARKKGRVQLLLEGDRWLVHGQLPHTSPLRCTGCGRRVQPVCYRSGEGEAAYCLSCALGDELGASASDNPRIRRAS